MDRIEKLKELLLQNPDDSFARHALALEFVKKGDDSAARMLFETVLQNDARYVGSYYHLGKLLERMGETDQAIRCYQKGMDMARDCGDQHAYSELRGALEELQDI